MAALGQRRALMALPQSITDNKILSVERPHHLEIRHGQNEIILNLHLIL